MQKRLLLDTNLLVLLVVGVISPTCIARHRRLREYSIDDFLLLGSIVARAKQLLTTPNILSETSNLSSQIAEPWRSRIASGLARLIERHEEIYLASTVATTRSEFVRLGLTDSVTLALCENASLLTVDLELYLAASRAGHDAQNFNHLRDGSTRR